MRALALRTSELAALHFTDRRCGHLIRVDGFTSEAYRGVGMTAKQFLS